MAEDAECTKNKKINDYKESVQAIGNSWIICRSQSHSGRIYYFNTLTGKSAWNLSDAEVAKAQLFSREGVSGTHVGDCPEPPEPPVDILPAPGHQNTQSKDAVARIYNKQIINNQFSKPCTDPAAFQNSHCHQCSSLNSVNDPSMNGAPLYNPAMWPIPPSHQVLLASAVSALANQAQPMFNGPNIALRNTLPNCFHIGHQSASQNLSYYQGFPKKKINKNPTRWNQNSHFNNMNNDLRDVLSFRRNNQRSHQDEPEKNKTYENHENSSDIKNEHGKSKLTADDLDSSDIDEDWLEANTIGDISCAWRECSGADCWFVVANTRVLLNNRKFLSKFIKAEEQIFLLTPLEVIKELRSATGDTDSGSRLVQRARCALRFAVQQMDKVPAGLKNLQNCTIEKCCSELVGQDYHVLFLLDDKEISSQINIDGASTFTIKQLKEFLNQKFNTLKAVIHENITVTISQNNGENKKTTSQSTQEAVTVHHVENRDELNSMQNNEIEIQTEQIMPVKKTVDACIQTDFEFVQSTDIPQSPVTKLLKSPTVVQPLNSETPKSPYLEESLKIDQALKTDAVVTSVDKNKEESEVATKKIRLNRNKLSMDHSTVKKPQFRWRKQRAKPSLITTASPKADVVSKNQTVSTKSPPSSLISISDLLPPENDKFSDLAKSIVFSDASNEKSSETLNKVIEESSLDVISNSIDDDIMPKISKNAILNESKNNEKDEIVMFEVTSDIMDDYLSRGCDEWLSRFVQIMEEALSQILQQEPSFFDPAMPPPWSVYEAIVCVKTKFKENSKIMFACQECGNFLLKISDTRGKIFADLNPSNFMRLYSYGVYLIEGLQSLLNDSEDLQIAKDSLAKLLNDIKNPNLDVAQNAFMDTFLTKKQDDTANVSDLVTDAGDDLVDTLNVSPVEKPKQMSCEPSPSRYNLRSSQRSNETNEKGLSEDDSVQNVVTDVSFFTSLKLQKTTSSTDINLATAAVFSPQQTCLSNHSFASGINENANENEDKEVNAPKIIRIFNFCSEIEEKLKSKQGKSLNESNDLDAEYDNFSNDNNYYENEFNFEDNFFANINDKSDSTQSDSEDNKSNDEIGTQILKFVRDKTIYPVHRALANLQSFCEATYEELYSQEKMDQLYKINLTEKINEVRKFLNNLRKHLNSVLCREDTKIKVRIMMEELGFLSSEINDTQVAVYGERFQKYLDQANILYESVDLIAAAIREKE